MKTAEDAEDAKSFDKKPGVLSIPCGFGSRRPATATVLPFLVCARLPHITYPLRTLRFVAHASSFYQMKQFLAEILSMIPGAFEGLRHEHDRSAVLASLLVTCGQVTVKDRVATAVNLGISL